MTDQDLGIIGSLLCLGWVGYCAKSYLDKYETQPRKDGIKLAEEQTKKAKLELQRERLRRRRRTPKVADVIEVIDDGEHKWEIVEEPRKERKVTDG